MKPEADFDTVYEMIEHAIEYAFEGRMQLKFYEFLKYRKTKKVEVDCFLNSSTAKELSDQVLELESYIKGGDKLLKEAYGHIPKPKARKIAKKILSDLGSMQISNPPPKALLIKYFSRSFKIYYYNL